MATICISWWQTVYPAEDCRPSIHTCTVFGLLDVVGKFGDKKIHRILTSGQMFVSLTYLWHSYMQVSQLQLFTY